MNSARSRRDGLLARMVRTAACAKRWGCKLEGVTYPEWFVRRTCCLDFRAHGYGQSNVVLDPAHWAIIPVIDKTGLWRCTYREEGGLSEEQVRALRAEALCAVRSGACGDAPAAVNPYRVHDRCAERFA